METGVPPLASHDPSTVNGASGAKSNAEFGFSKEKYNLFFFLQPLKPNNMK